MFESVHWKTELKKAAREIVRRQTYGRATEKQITLFEREVLIALFCVRALIERHKIGSDFADKRLKLRAYPIRKGKTANLLNRWNPDEVYDMERSVAAEISVKELCNQAVHSYNLHTVQDRDAKKFVNLLLCSDFQRNNQLYEIPVALIVSLICEASENYPYEAIMHKSYDKRQKTWDYKVISRSAPLTQRERSLVIHRGLSD